MPYIEVYVGGALVDAEVVPSSRIELFDQGARSRKPAAVLNQNFRLYPTHAIRLCRPGLH